VLQVSVVVPAVAAGEEREVMVAVAMGAVVVTVYVLLLHTF
jgi:hypothetical protein